MSSRRYIIGIDLGTTNSAVSFIDLSVQEGKRRKVEIFRIPQLTGPGEVSELNLLPSFAYIPGDHDIPKEALALSWAPDDRVFAGAFARDHGVRVPNRMVSSAKSWLCHSRVDRRAPVLPWGAGEEIPKLSPVSATAAYLRHIKEAWNQSRAGNEELYLENQDIIITVPASFDEVARDLTVESATEAGMHNVTLLEEPLSAFYHWLFLHEEEWDRFVHPGELILVCDVGGGTTDFTLITLRDVGGTPSFERIAVGDHLILGGDNMDLALARRLETRLKKGERGHLTPGLWQGLCHQCREAKESILDGIKVSQTITVVGEGRRLIADTVSTTLDRDEVEETVLEGFFPLIDRSDSLAEVRRTGLTEFGLPYAQDAAVTRHMIRFLIRHREDVSTTLGRQNPQPDLILFNGGALKPQAVRERIRAAIRHWFHEEDESRPRVLVNPDLDLAVALGASYYGLVRKGHGVKVRSGSPRAFYLGVGKLQQEGTGVDVHQVAVCLVERGMEEGRKNELEDRKFEVLANQPVAFDLYSSSFRTGDHVGDVIRIDDTLTPLPPLRTVIRFGKKAKETKLPVRVEAHYTEVGTLSLWCRSIGTEHRWRLQFQLRDAGQEAKVADHEILEESLVNACVQQIRVAFPEGSSAVSPALLVKAMTEKVRLAKERWPLSFIRTATDELLHLMSSRKRSAEHESRWLNLMGFCLRPGFGDALDEHRIQRLWKIYQPGPIHAKDVQVRCEWWVLWRRVAGGLDASQQRQVLQVISALIRPKKKSEKKRLPPQEQMEVWMTLANLERLPISEKSGWGCQLLEMLTPKSSRPQYWWALARIGAREPLYGPIDRVIPPDEISTWIESILARSWRNPKPVGLTLSQLARLTGDRKRDLPTAVRRRVIDWLRTTDASDHIMNFLEKTVPISAEEQTAIFGESLPPGILMHIQEHLPSSTAS